MLNILITKSKVLNFFHISQLAIKNHNFYSRMKKKNYIYIIIYI